MNNANWRFTINLKKKILVSDEMQFIDELELSKEIWYEFPHYFAGDNITWYKAVIIEVDINNIDYVKELYNITPNIIYWYNNIKFHLVFNSKKILNTYDYKRVSETLAFLYNWIALEYHFYPANWITTENISEIIDDNLIDVCTKIYFYREKEITYQKLFTISEYDRYVEANNLDIAEVIEKLYEKDTLTTTTLISGIDIRTNLHKDYWNCFEIVMNFYSSIEKTKKFFLENFEIQFENVNPFDHTKSKKWFIITEWQNLFLDKFWYFTLDWNWGRKQLTDFYIKVHNKIILNNGKHHFVVSLINEAEWVETKKIIWENRTSTWTFSDFIQAYWPYHYYWTAPFIKEIHRLISWIKQVAEIKQVVWYWHHKDENVIIFKNWVWDMEHKMFTKKKDEDDDFYYKHDSTWFWVTDKQENNLSDILTEWVPHLDLNKLSELDDVIDFMGKLYADNSWSYLIFLAFGMMWYLLYWDQSKQFPLIFTRWITGSGKTAYNELLQRIWGIKKAWSDFENSTLFTMTVTLSYLIKFPYFISEYREAASMRLQKVWTLRSVFDKISQTKWRADQSVVKYDYVAIPVLDWEEMIVDWALRTRSIQYQLLKKHKIQWNFNKILRDWWDILDTILFTYLSKSNWEKYQQYLDEGYDIFKPLTTQNRIAQNIASIYAWCMCFNSTKKNKDDYILVLSEVVEFQEEDVLQNSTSMQIVKVMGKFLENTYTTWVFVRKNDIVISRNTLEDYVSKYRVETTLKINSYKEHLIAMWFNIDYVEVWESYMEWVIIPFTIIPKHLLVHHEVYKWYKDWKNLNNIE